MERLKVTPGDTTLSPQLRNMMAQVWDTEGKSLAIIETTDDPVVATNIAIIFSNAYNTYNKCGKLPSEMMEECAVKDVALTNLDWKAAELELQNRELIEALKKIVKILEEIKLYHTDRLTATHWMPMPVLRN